MRRLNSAAWLIMLCSVGASCQTTPVARVYGTISLLDARATRPIRLGGVELIFKADDTSVVEVKSKENGEYTAILRPMMGYRVTVSNYMLCSIHRPSFYIRPGEAARLNFTMVFCTSLTVTVGPPGTPAQSSDYQESAIPYGEHRQKRLIVGFGTHPHTSGVSAYGPLRVYGTYPTTLPVTVMFGLYTIDADQVTVDARGRILEAKGNVVVWNGSSGPPATFACIRLDLTMDDPKAMPCSL